ncbi:hypothetical protein X751_16385 [Mesorhizobium sp. LNJC395A00]|nr:hypothetical protein X751_16385 [Mesorhizobium sp. LNJC395A00]
MLISASNVHRINADDELFATISGKLHLKLASVIRLGPRAPSCMTWSSSRSPILMVRFRTVACVSVGSVGRKSASTFSACR